VSPAARDSGRAALLETYSSVQALLHQLAELYRCEDEGATYDKAVDVLRRHFPVHHHRVYARSGPAFAVAREPQTALTALVAPVEAAELAFSADQRGVSFVPYDVPDRPSPAIKGRLLVPIEAGPASGARLAAGPVEVAAVLVLFVDLDLALDRHALEVAEHVGQAIASTLDKIRLLVSVRSQTDLLDNVLESIPLGLVAIDLSDRIITFNRNAELMLGIRRFYVMKARYDEVLPERLSEVLRSMLLLTLKEQGTVNYELEHPLDAKTTVSLGLTSSTIYDRGNRPTGVLFVCRDLALTREVEKLRKLDQLKDEFVHTVSHELKTPLTAILGGTEILLLDASKFDREQLELMNIVDEGARRLRTLINDLLDLSKLEGGGIELARSEAMLAELADATIEMLSIRGNCTVVRDYAPGLRPIGVDRDKIRQVLENLLSNAIKYSPDGGTITVRIHLADGGAAQQVDVVDQGIGLAPDDHERVFEKFYRVNASRTAEVEGTGLGLSITRHIVEMHRGRIWVSSELGKGSTFSFAIPVH